MSLRARLMEWSFALDRAARALVILREELAFRTFTERDWLDLGRALYGRESKYSKGSDHNESGLFAFECDAIELAFPPAPAAILVGACGGGREILGLLERGYSIAAAYDPVEPLVHALREDPRLVELRDRVCVGTHQEVESLPPIRRLTEMREPIDAVLVGWGSYAHLRGTARRVEFLRSLRALCPTGPVLLSFLAEMGREPERLARVRATMRRLLRTTGAMVETGDGLHRGQGAIHFFTEGALIREATEAGYRVQHWREHEFGAAHAVLVPQTPSESHD